jgi:hypothetical protein
MHTPPSGHRSSSSQRPAAGGRHAATQSLLPGVLVVAHASQTRPGPHESHASAVQAGTHSPVGKKHRAPGHSACEPQNAGVPVLTLAELTCAVVLALVLVLALTLAADDTLAVPTTEVDAPSPPFPPAPPRSSSNTTLPPHPDATIATAATSTRFTPRGDSPVPAASSRPFPWPAQPNHGTIPK